MSGRISHQTIEEVISRTDIESIIGKYTDLKKNGKYLKGLCPLHDEKTPSFTITPSKDVYKCFGCGSSGSVIGFLMEKENFTYPEAIEALAAEYKITIEREGKPKTAEDIEQDKRYDLAMRAAMNLYQERLAALPEDAPVWQELKENRCLTDEIIGEFQLGWAPDAWTTLKDKVVNTGYWNECEKLGLVKNHNGKNYDTLRNRIVFPQIDHRGKLVGYGGRYLGWKDELKKDGIPKYLNSSESPLFNKSLILYGLYQAKKAIIEAGFAYLVEGYFDVLAMHMANECNVVATNGTSLSKEQVCLLKRLCNRVVIMRDNDPAGQKAAIHDMEMLLAEGMSVDVCILPDGQDPDEFIRSGTITEEMI